MTALSWASYFSALLPLGFLLVARLDVGAAFWIVGIAWLTALGSDTQALLDGGTWINTHVWPVLTFALLARAFVEDDLRWWAVAGTLSLIGWLVVQGSMQSPDVFVPLLGSAVVLYHASGPLRTAMLWYCGAGTLLYIAYALTTDWYSVALACWIAYKAATLIAFGLYGAAAIREARRA